MEHHENSTEPVVEVGTKLQGNTNSKEVKIHMHERSSPDKKYKAAPYVFIKGEGRKLESREWKENQIGSAEIIAQGCKREQETTEAK